MKEMTLSRREREKLWQRQQMLNAAVELFSRKGYHHVTMHEIAQKAEFAIGTLLIVAYVTELHRRFWGLALWKSIVLTVAIWLFTALVVSPLLLTAVQALDRIDWIAKLVK